MDYSYHCITESQQKRILKFVQERIDEGKNLVDIIEELAGIYPDLKYTPPWDTIINILQEKY